MTDDKTPAERVRALVVEGDPHVRTLMTWLLREDPRIDVVGALGTGDEAAAWSEPIHVALVDLAVPGLDALRTVSVLRERHPEATVVVMADVDVPYLRAAAMLAGATGYITRPRRERRDWPAW